MLMNRPSKPDRRRFLLNSGMLAAAWQLSFADAALTQELAPTPSCHDGDGPTVSETEGPFFKPRPPERSDLREPGVRGRQFELSGVVLSRSRRPLRGAVVDFWHADEKGEYDNIGFRYRGHVITGPDGAFCFRTIVPALYSGARGTTTSRFKRSAAVY
jgi:protocatechuate 3,4-dioxygenase beta subunit